jgi:hypothetical protein
VDGSVPEPGDGRSWETAVQKIQEGIDAASHGDIVIVAPATYVENIHFHGKNITVTRRNPCDPAVVANTILDGQAKGSVVTFSGSEDDACVLTGFTIRNGQAKDGGGIAGSGTYATIQNNVITKNIATYGGGIAYCHGMIQNNTLTGNSASGHGGGLAYCHGLIQRNNIECNSARDDGGGLHECNGTINGNTIFCNLTVIDDGAGLCQCDGKIDGNLISENSANDDGGGLAYCHGTIQNNIVTSNSARDFSGGLYSCNGTIQNNVIADNSGKHGGGLSHCSGTVVNNTVTANIAAGDGGGFYACGGTIRNCIIFGNVAPLGPQLYTSSTPIYSCIEDWTEGGEGNITDNPQFISAPDSDFRLTACSRCIDAGENYFSAYFDADAAGMGCGRVIVASSIAPLQGLDGLIRQGPRATLWDGHATQPPKAL